LADVVVAGAVAAVEISGSFATAAHRGRPVTALGLALLVAGSAALIPRRRYPVAVLALTYGAAFAYLTTQVHTAPVWGSVIVALVTAIYLRRRVAAVSFILMGYVGFLWGPTIAGKRAPSPVFALGLALGLGALIGGSELYRLRRQRSVAVGKSRREQRLRHASEERVRIARDLHDTVAHNISAINIQAKTALHLMDREPDQVRDALSTIHDMSKQALVELRSILNVLRDVDGTAPRRPAPGLDQLPALLATTKAAGVQAVLREAGDKRPLPSEVSLAAYRIIQEALTNAARHSGGDHADVMLVYRPDDLLIEVADNGTVRPPIPGNGTGVGVTGMTERARALGGSLSVTAHEAGGVVIRARLPTGACCR
jgi:signal transduction histidine kinase